MDTKRDDIKKEIWGILNEVKEEVEEVFTFEPRDTVGVAYMTRWGPMGR